MYIYNIATYICRERGWFWRMDRYEKVRERDTQRIHGYNVLS